MKPRQSALDRHHKHGTQKRKNQPHRLLVKGSKLMRTVAEAIVHGRKEKYGTADNKQHDSDIRPHDFPQRGNETSAAHHENGVAEDVQTTVDR